MKIIKKRSFISIGLLCATIAIAESGCSSIGGDFGSVIPDGQKAAITPGTSKTKVLQEIGNPDQRIDLGNGKEQFSYIKERVSATGSAFGINQNSSNMEFWIVFDAQGLVESKGERPTTKQPNYFK